MKKLLAGTALAVAFLAPLSAAKAFDFCTTGLTLNFCGSVVVTTASADGGNSTLVTIQVLNTSGGPAGGSALAIFTAVGLTDVSDIGTLSNFSVTTTNGGNYSTNWALETNKVIGGGISVDILSSTTNGINYGLSSLCSGAPTPNPVYTGGSGIGGCALNYVTFSFTSSTNFADFSAGDIFFKAQGGGFSSDCDFSLPNGTPLSCGGTSVPEPASIVLLGTGLMALGRRAYRWRQRNENA